MLFPALSMHKRAARTLEYRSTGMYLIATHTTVHIFFPFVYYGIMYIVFNVEKISTLHKRLLIFIIRKLEEPVKGYDGTIPVVMYTGFSKYGNYRLKC
jgi:hypothetical protein